MGGACPKANSTCCIQPQCTPEQCLSTCRHHCSRLGLDNSLLHALNDLSAAAERFGPLSVEHKHIFSIHGLAPLLLTPDILVSPLCLMWAVLFSPNQTLIYP